MTEELEKEVEEYLHNNYCCKGSYCGFNAECKEGVRIRCSEFDILKKHIINFEESRKERIVELEKELEDAKKVQVVEHFEAYGQCRDSRRITELEQKNAELKSRDCWKGCLYASGKSELIHEFLQQKYNLTKAKKIIKALLRLWNDVMTEETVKALIAEAEQFLNSEVEK